MRHFNYFRNYDMLQNTSNLTFLDTNVPTRIENPAQSNKSAPKHSNLTKSSSKRGVTLVSSNLKQVQFPKAMQTVMLKIMKHALLETKTIILEILGDI